MVLRGVYEWSDPLFRSKPLPNIILKVVMRQGSHSNLVIGNTAVLQHVFIALSIAVKCLELIFINELLS